MRRNASLSLKKHEHRTKVRKDARDPFIVYDFYDKLEKLMSKILDKSTFTKLLSDVWLKVITPTNIINGFKSTGIFPVNRTMFPDNLFEVADLERYKSFISQARLDEAVIQAETVISP